MARRTTADKVAAVLGSDWDGARPLVPFIDAVNGLVDEVVRLASQNGRTLATAQAVVVETWLAAWAYAMADPTLDSKNTSRAGGTFSGKTAMNLDANRYGQTAKVLDTSRVLTAMDKGLVASSAWLGKPPSEQTDYVDRD